MKVFRLISLIEGISLVTLLFIAMPLKYQFGVGEAVAYVGITHGCLFLIYMVMSLSVSHQHQWSIFKWLAVFFAGVLPFGFLLVDKQLRADPITAAVTENT